MALKVIDTYFAGKEATEEKEITVGLYVYEDGEVGLIMNNVIVLYILKDGSFLVARESEERLTEKKIPTSGKGQIKITGIEQ